jgi:hypothetical protein
MKVKIRHIITGLLSIVVLWLIVAVQAYIPAADKVTEINNKIEWLKSNHAYGSACIRITHGKVIYIDPSHLSNVQTSVKADLILVTHSHDDHFSIQTLHDLQKEITTIVAPRDCRDELIKPSPRFKFKTSSPGDKLTMNDITIEAVPA